MVSSHLHSYSILVVHGATVLNMERRDDRPRRNTMSLLVNSDEEELRPTCADNEERGSSEPSASNRTNGGRQGGNAMHAIARGQDVLNETISLQEQRPNFVGLDYHDRVAQDVFVRFGNIGRRRNDAVATGTHAGLNHPPPRSSAGVPTRDPRLHGIGGYAFKNRGGQTQPRIPSGSQEAHPPSRDSPRFLPPRNNHRLPEPPSPLEKCYVAPRLRPLYPENVTQPRSICSIRVPSSRNIQKQSEHGSYTQPGASGSEQTFDSLIEIVLNHPMFPLIFKGVCETTTGKTPVIDNTRSKVLLEQTVEKVEEYETLCREQGLLNAQQYMNGVDLYFAVFNAAFKSLQSDEQPSIPAPLHAMIFASGRRERQKNAGTTDEFNSHSNRQTTDTPAKRPKPSDAARKRLDDWFKDNYKNPYPTAEEKQQLAHECGIAMEQVSTLRCPLLRCRTNVLFAD